MLSFGGYAADSGAETEPGTMYFAFGRSFIGYWRVPDDRIAWFAALPSTEPLTSAEVNQIPPATG
ncbi:hypothetical protein PV703_32570 [Streptomyces sp. ME01-24h]|nr:hypothetical protein [Streptomyces sp. ME19-03-3]MDX3357941.1 hypothetical protein [Streptomyces sp. ME01-24h]